MRRQIEVSDALEELARLDLRQAEVVKLRFFIGLKPEEIAALHGVSENLRIHRAPILGQLVRCSV